MNYALALGNAPNAQQISIFLIKMEYARYVEHSKITANNVLYKINVLAVFQVNIICRRAVVYCAPISIKDASYAATNHVFNVTMIILTILTINSNYAFHVQHSILFVKHAIKLISARTV